MIDITTFSLARASYPYWLRSIPDAPALLHVRGKLPAGRRCVACVGTRYPSAFGRVAAQRISKFLALQGWSIISGLAHGVDTLCHEAALEAKGHTVAVLANGLDSIYPHQNKRLAERILASGGALVSEQPLGTPARPKHLTKRNRIQSGMSVATVVMQTDLIGGTMHTARYTLLQGRLLVAPVPEGAHAQEPKSRGLYALTQVPGRDLASLLSAKGAYKTLLEQGFIDRPAAFAITSRDSYEELLIRLEAALQQASPCPQESAIETAQLSLL